jgi:hypothetical protein
LGQAGVGFEETPRRKNKLLLLGSGNAGKAVTPAGARSIAHFHENQKLCIEHDDVELTEFLPVVAINKLQAVGFEFTQRQGFSPAA